MASNNKIVISERQEEALGLLRERIQELNMEFPRKLLTLLVEVKALSTKPDATDKFLRTFIYREMYNYLARENEIGEGLSLIYPTEIVETIRRLYSEDVCNYPPKSRKNFYEVPLRELLEVYREGDLRSGEIQPEPQPED